MIDEEMNSYGDEGSDEIKKMDQPNPEQEDTLGHFDEAGKFRYDHSDRDPQENRHIDLKHLSEQKFTDLIEAKNQDKRFYHWLHFHPLFDDEDWDNEKSKSKTQIRERRGSEQINIKKDLLVESDSEDDFNAELYAGISCLFEEGESK